MEELVADAIDLVEVQSETITQVPKALSFPWSGRIHPIGHDIIKRFGNFRLNSDRHKASGGFREHEDIALRRPATSWQRRFPFGKRQQDFDGPEGF